MIQSYSYKSFKRKSLGLVCTINLLSIICTHSFAQVADITLSTPSSGIYTATHSIALNPGFSANGTNGFQAYIVPVSLFSCAPLLASPSQDQNYIMTTVPRVPITDASSLGNKNTCEAIQTIEYFDGLGRSIQTVDVKASPSSRDVVQAKAYDPLGRESVRYLPYVVSPAAVSDGHFKTNALAEQLAFYKNPVAYGAQYVASTNFPYAETKYDGSPLDRTVEQGSVDDAWQLTGKLYANNAGHTLKTNYLFNNNVSYSNDPVTSRQVAFYAAVINADGTRTLNSNATFADNQLYVIISKDENWQPSDGKAGQNEVYQDKDGHVVLKRIYNNNNGNIEVLSTYYVYDDMENLSYVLPPKANPDLPNSINQNALDALCFQYRYDSHNRLIAKKMPGKGWEFMIYNALNQVVLTQDAVQRNKTTQEWTFVKYKAGGGILMTGIFRDIGSVSDDAANTNRMQYLQSIVDQQSILWEERDNSNSATGYTNVAFPIDNYYNSPNNNIAAYLGINYYDDYNVPSMPYNSFVGSNMTKGLVTANKISILDNPSVMLWKVNYYDDKARLIKSYQQHYLNSVVSVNNFDDLSIDYDFSNNVTSTTRNHYNTSNNSPIVTVKNNYVYDNIGRPIQTFEQINSEATVLLSQRSYNEIGELAQKQIHSEDSGNNFIEAISYSYNPSGWNTEISSSHFDEKLYYNAPSGTLSGVSANYNGNISEAWYNSTFVNDRRFAYGYDKLNRLTSANSYLGNTYVGNFDEIINYDIAGNIQSLSRGSYGTQNYIYSGNFGYSYNGNRLGAVTNNGSTYRNYSYDLNGNSISNGAFDIDYNLLNLPTSVKQTGSIFNTYTYDATGRKLRKGSTVSGSTDYISGIEYKNGAIDFIATEEGRYEFNSHVYQYDLKDHLGNVRVMIQKNNNTSAVPVQEQEFYAFGLNAIKYDLSTNSRYSYNGKEMQDDNNFNQYDYGSRLYDPVISRWSVVDNMAENHFSTSPYVYAINNPIQFTDPDGNDIVAFDENGHEITRIRTNSFFESYYRAAGGSFIPGLAMLRGTFKRAKMPGVFHGKGTDPLDYQIAASTAIWNDRLKSQSNLPIPKGHKWTKDTKIRIIDVNVIKSIIQKESIMGTTKDKSGSGTGQTDVMQSNVAGDFDINADLKTPLGMYKYEKMTPETSIQKGIGFFVLRGMMINDAQHNYTHMRENWGQNGAVQHYGPGPEYYRNKVEAIYNSLEPSVESQSSGANGSSGNSNNSFLNLMDSPLGGSSGIAPNNNS